MKKDALSVAKELVKILEELHKENMVVLSELKPGEKFTTGIGNFIVLEQKEDSTVVITEGLYRKNVSFDDDSNKYFDSELADLFEDEIYPEFKEEFGSDNLCDAEASLTTADMQNGDEILHTNVRPLTFDEAREYNDLLANKDLPDWYWTCTPWSTKERGFGQTVAVVSPRGYFYDYYCSINCGVRPVCILKSNIFVSKVTED